MSDHNQQLGDLYRQMYDPLLEYGRCTLGNYSLAEEAVQDTFQIACLKAEELCASQCPEGWLVRTMRNVMSNMTRSRVTSSRILAEYIAAHSRELTVAEDRMRLEILYADIADMEEFQLIREMAIDGCSHLDMAKKRGITVETCRKRVQRARNILRKIISE